MINWHRLLHSIVIVGLMLAMWLGLAAIAFGLAVQVFEQQITWTLQIWESIVGMAALVTLAVGITAISREARWPWLAGAGGLVASLFVFLAYDAPPVPPVDLGIRIGQDDPGYQAMMWLSDNSPCSRTKKAGTPDWENKQLLLPEKVEDWPEFMKAHEAEILHAWETDKLGRDWISILSTTPPKGIWYDHLNGPMLNFLVVRHITTVRLAHAISLAQTGRRDEALDGVNQVLQSNLHIQQSSHGLLHQAIVSVVNQRCYSAINFIVNTGPTTGSSRKALLATLQLTLQPKETFRLAFLGQAERTHEIVFSSAWNADNLNSSFKHEECFDFGFRLGAKCLLMNPNQTEGQIARIITEMRILAEARDISALESYRPTWNKASPFKNPVGRLITIAIVPAFSKPCALIWNTEDQRLALMQKLTAAN